MFGKKGISSIHSHAHSKIRVFYWHILPRKGGFNGCGAICRWVSHCFIPRYYKHNAKETRTYWTTQIADFDLLASMVVAKSYFASLFLFVNNVPLCYTIKHKYTF